MLILIIINMQLINHLFKTVTLSILLIYSTVQEIIDIINL